MASRLSGHISLKLECDRCNYKASYDDHIWADTDQVDSEDLWDDARNDGWDDSGDDLLCRSCALGGMPARDIGNLTGYAFSCCALREICANPKCFAGHCVEAENERLVNAMYERNRQRREARKAVTA